MMSRSSQREENEYRPDWADRAEHIPSKPNWVDGIPHELWDLGEVFFPLPYKKKAHAYPHHLDEYRYYADDEIMNAYIEAARNYGIACAGDIAVVDIDEIMYADEMTDDLPPTLWQRTGSGRGVHLFYICPGLDTRQILEIEWMETDNEKDDGYMHVGEIKCDPHGYVVGPGSVHPSGNRYGPLKGEEIATIEKENLLDALDDYIHEKKTETKYVEFEKRSSSEDDESQYEFYNLTTDNAVPWLGEDTRVPHPAHGSSTGKNFMKPSGEEIFMCWRHDYGGTQGCALNPQQLLAVIATGVDCDVVRMNWDKDPTLHYHAWLEALDRQLVSRKDIPYTVARGYAIEKGYLGKTESLDGDAYWDTINALRCEVTEQFLPEGDDLQMVDVFSWGETPPVVLYTPRVCGQTWVQYPVCVGEQPHNLTMKAEVKDPDLVDTFDADKRGRVSLGKDFANSSVRLVAEVVEEDSNSGDNNQ